MRRNKNIVTDDTLLYGEALLNDECLCDEHGCRLAFHYAHGWICPECELDIHERELEEIREANEQIYYEEICENQLDRGSCTVIHGKGFTAFSCTMPWWA